MSDAEERRRGLDPVRAAAQRVRRGLCPFCDGPAAEGCCCSTCFLDKHMKMPTGKAGCCDECPNPDMRKAVADTLAGGLHPANRGPSS